MDLSVIESSKSCVYCVAQVKPFNKKHCLRLYKYSRVLVKNMCALVVECVFTATTKF